MRQKRLSTSLLICSMGLLLALTGCSNQRKQPASHNEKLVIHIHEDGTKLFAYALAAGGLGGGPGNGPRGGAMAGGQPSGGGMNNGGGGSAGNPAAMKRGNPEHDLGERLEAMLATTGFCRTGYIEIEQYTDQQASWIRGECKEAATNEDWARFGSRVSLF